jgi:hypothetical protein
MNSKGSLEAQQTDFQLAVSGKGLYGGTAGRNSRELRGKGGNTEGEEVGAESHGEVRASVAPWNSEIFSSLSVEARVEGEIYGGAADTKTKSARSGPALRDQTGLHGARAERRVAGTICGVRGSHVPY